MDKTEGKDKQFEFICTKCQKYFWVYCPDGEYCEYSIEHGRQIIKSVDGKFRRMVVCPNCTKWTIVVRPRLVSRVNYHKPRRFDNLKG